VAILNVRVIVEAFVLLVISRCSVWRMHNYKLVLLNYFVPALFRQAGFGNL
jgi:hypothetical protein